MGNPTACNRLECINTYDSLAFQFKRPIIEIEIVRDGDIP